MITFNKISKYIIAILVLGIMLISCERELTDEAEFATLTTDGTVFIDGFTFGLNYFPFIDAGADPEAFSVETTEVYSGDAAMRFDVPTFGNGFVGATFSTTGKRDLSGYDALTFYAKASQGASIDVIGFGINDTNQHLTTLEGLDISTNWKKYVIPIPDPSKLTGETGLFYLAEGASFEGGEGGYILWFDEIQFEKLGTVAQPSPSIFNGEDTSTDTFIGVDIPITGLTQTFNLASGQNQTVSASPYYFEFESSNPNVASVDSSGMVNVLSAGTAVITASLGGVRAEGSLIINSLGNFELAPVPTRDPADVVSIFSDTYDNVPVDFFNGFWEPFQTTLSADFAVEGNNILNYTNFNFVGNQFSNPTVDATEKSNLHIDMYIPGEVPTNFDFLITVVDFGPDQVEGGGDDTRQQIFFGSSDVQANTWSTLEASITMENRNNLGLIIYENINGSSLSNFYLDNIYFYAP